ncbi:hypothetical protein ACS0TY_005668 [Phlomoides rotata]
MFGFKRVLSWKLDASNYETDLELKKIREEHGYTCMDFCEVYPEKLPNYKEKIRNFYEEHLHTDEKSCCCVAGNSRFIKICESHILLIDETISKKRFYVEGYFDMHDHGET